MNGKFEEAKIFLKRQEEIRKEKAIIGGLEALKFTKIADRIEVYIQALLTGDKKNKRSF